MGISGSRPPHFPKGVSPPLKYRIAGHKLRVKEVVFRIQGLCDFLPDSQEISDDTGDFWQGWSSATLEDEVVGPDEKGKISK